MTCHPYSYAAVALLAAALGACGIGETGRQAAVAVSSSAHVSAADRAWLAAMHQADLADVQLGRLAERKGATAAVRHAGSMLAADHTTFDQKVTGVASGLGVELPKTEKPEQLALAQRLQKESGSRFDHAFVTAMVAEHKKAIAAAGEEIRTGSSPAVTGLAHAALPALREHLSMLRKASPVG
jgi:predicted outer membrane protein